MGRKPVIVIFFALLVVLTYAQFRLDARLLNLKGFEINLLERERNIRLLAAMTESLTLTGRKDLVDGHLDDAIRVRWIDFYMMTYDGEVTAFNSRRPLSSEAYSTIKTIHPPEAFWEFDSKFESVRSVRGPAADKVDGTESFSFFEADLGEKRRLKLGFNRDREAFLAATTEYSAAEDRRVYILTLLIVLGVFLFSARDLLRVAKVVRTKGIRGLNEIRVISKEAEALKTSLSGFGEAVGRLERDNRILGAQVLPSLRRELQLGKEPPYDFNCTMVRTDINNFTQIFHSHPIDQFLATINEFFVECSHIISRYDGLIHEFVGDEIIFYFKDDQHTNSFTAALACAREIGEIATQFHERTMPLYPFRIKSSLAYGKIRFGPLLNGFSLAGAPLIETVRILSAVNEKNENTIHFDSPNVVRLHDGVEFTESFRANLKGMENERTVMKYGGHVSLDKADPTFFDDYRSDADVIGLLKMVEADPGSASALSAISVLGRIVITKCEPSVQSTLLSTIERLLQSDAVDHTEMSRNRALSKLAESLSRLVPPGMIEGFVDVIAKLLEHRDSRVVANTIESLQKLRDSGAVSRKLDDRLLDSKNTRVAVNALVYVGTVEISNLVNKRIRNLIASSDVGQVSAGLFAWGEIAGHHYKNDPVYYSTQLEFQALSRQFEKTIERFPSVAIRAKEAALKAGDQTLARHISDRACA